MRIKYVYALTHAFSSAASGHLTYGSFGFSVQKKKKKNHYLVKAPLFDYLPIPSHVRRNLFSRNLYNHEQHCR